MQTRESRNINAALDLPAHFVEGMAVQSAGMRSLTFAQLVALVARIDRSLINALQTRSVTAGHMSASLDEIEAQLACMWAMVEAELQRRLDLHRPEMKGNTDAQS